MFIFLKEGICRKVTLFVETVTFTFIRSEDPFLQINLRFSTDVHTHKLNYVCSLDVIPMNMVVLALYYSS